MPMRSRVAGLVLTGMILGQPGAARAHSQAGEAGMALAAVVANTLYVPAKMLVATGGMVVGALAGAATGGDTRTAYAFWVPAGGGTYMLRPAHIDGTEPIQFFGSDYADTPSSTVGEPEAGALYDSLYGVMR